MEFDIPGFFWLFGLLGGYFDWVPSDVSADSVSLDDFENASWFRNGKFSQRIFINGRFRWNFIFRVFWLFDLPGNSKYFDLGSTRREFR